MPEPTDADALLDKAYAKMIGIADSPDTLVAFNRLLGNPIDEFTTEQLDQVMDYLDKLRPNVRTLYQYGEESDLLARGDLGVAFQTFGSLLGAAQTANADVKGNFVGSVSFADCFSILGDGDVVKATAWIDNALGMAGQKALQTASGSYPVLPAATDPKALPPLLAETPLDELLEKAPIDEGVPVKGDGLVTRDSLTETWNDFKASF